MRSLPLEEVHLKARAELGDAGGAARVQSYGDPGPLAAMARAGVGLCDLSDRTRLAVVGPDRQSWLQGMITNDVGKLTAGQGCAALALSNKGKIVADLRVQVRPGELWLDCVAQRGEVLREHLSRFIIMEECEVRDVSTELAVVGVVGPQAVALAREIFRLSLGRLSLGRPSPDLAPQAQVEVRAPTLGELPAVAVGWNELGLPGLAFWLRPTQAPALWEALALGGARPLGFDAMEILRIEAGRPREGAELDEDVLPPEAGLTAEISGTKGCYLGQEVMARLMHRGHVNRKLVGLKLSAVPAALPAPLKAPAAADKEVGALRSAVVSPSAGPIGLGYVRREHWAVGTELTFEGGTATVVEVPFVPGN